MPLVAPRFRSGIERAHKTPVPLLEGGYVIEARDTSRYGLAQGSPGSFARAGWWRKDEQLPSAVGLHKLDLPPSCGGESASRILPGLSSKAASLRSSLRSPDGHPALFLHHCLSYHSMTLF
jgi:hypothetical protein